ncbi:response regulator [Roseobacter cerasinus]|uniref:response regulator n=1 Tax=Roseobacter cerasinus TaxID=2602289 RepID=UPI0013592ED1|nr:response regulator [Roseobacter cerasinus]
MLDTVLLVDDDKVTNLMHTRIIRRSALARTVDVATDGVAALDYLQTRLAAGQGCPDLILLDINMPRMDGFEFLENYSALPEESRCSDTLIVMLSTSVLEADRARAEAHPDLHAFLNKPLTVDDMLRFAETSAEVRDALHG